MKVVITTSDDRLLNLDVPSNLRLIEMRSLCAAEVGKQAEEVMLTLNGSPLLQDDATLSMIGIQDGDLLGLTSAAHSPMHSSTRVHQTTAVSGARNPRLKMNLDSVEIQERIAEGIRQQNVESNMAMAIEYFPESFGSVNMLYINCKVNGKPTKAFVDTGAQTTIMSKQYAGECGLLRLLDIRFQGEAHGVGVQAILGKIHMAQLEIDGSFFAASFTVLDGTRVHLLLGLDILKRHQCIVDLEQSALLLRVADGKHVRTAFLTESELPPEAKLVPVLSKGKEVKSDDSKPADIDFCSEANLSAVISGTGCSTDEAMQALIHHEGSVPKAKVSVLISKLGDRSKIDAENTK